MGGQEGPWTKGIELGLCQVLVGLDPSVALARIGSRWHKLIQAWDRNKVLLVMASDLEVLSCQYQLGKLYRKTGCLLWIVCWQILQLVCLKCQKGCRRIIFKYISCHMVVNIITKPLLYSQSKKLIFCSNWPYWLCKDFLCCRRQRNTNDRMAITVKKI